MRLTTKLSLVSALGAPMLTPETARADGFVIPWIGGNVGSRAAGGFTDFGVSAGYTAASVVDFDVDFDYSPDFYADRFSSYTKYRRRWDGVSVKSVRSRTRPLLANIRRGRDPIIYRA